MGKLWVPKLEKLRIFKKGCLRKEIESTIKAALDPTLKQNNVAKEIKKCYV